MGVPLHTKKNPGASPLFTPEDFKFVRLRNAAGDFNMATTAQEWKYTVAAGRIFKWTRSVIRMKSAGIDIGDFGGIAGGLSEGCLLMVHDFDDSVLLDPMDTLPIKTNGDFADMAATDVRPETSTGLALDQFTARWTVERNGEPVSLTEGQHVAFTTRDDISALTFMSIILHGTEYEIP